MKKTILIISILFSLMILAGCKGNICTNGVDADGNCLPLDGHCPGFPPSDCTKGHLSLDPAKDPSCKCTGVQQSCFDSPTNIVPVLRANNYRVANQFCDGNAVSQDNCCRVDSYPTIFQKNIYHDCLPGSASPGRAAPACWYQVAKPTCHGYLRQGADPSSCAVTDYYGLCFQPCLTGGADCTVGQDQCCKNGCYDGYASAGQTADLKCFHDSSSNTAAEVGKCRECDFNQYPCGHKCYTPSPTASCCGTFDVGNIYNPQTQGCCGSGANAEVWIRSMESCCGTGTSAKVFKIGDNIGQRATNCCENGILTADCGTGRTCCVVSDGSGGRYNQCTSNSGYCKGTSSGSSLEIDPCKNNPYSSCNGVSYSYCIPKPELQGTSGAAQGCATHKNNPSECSGTLICDPVTVSCSWQATSC